MKHRDRRPTPSKSLGPAAGAALLWVLSDLGFYFLLPVLGIAPDYNTSGVQIALYYGFWCGVAAIAFWPHYSGWQRFARWPTLANRPLALTLWVGFFAVAVWFVGWGLPALPPFDLREGVTPPALPLASGLYFLPKSFEILFQQMLVLALVLVLAARGISLMHSSLISAALFGAAHLLLALGGAPWGYVIRFTVMASLFGMVVPSLLLRVPMGLAVSYMTHWGFYALVLTVARLLGAPVSAG